MKLLQAFAATALLTFACLPLKAGTAMFSYSDIDQEPAVWGTSGKEYYDAAIRISQPGLVGMKITGVNIPMFAHEDITDIRVWLASKLELDNKHQVVDILEVPATIADDKIDVDFAEGYVIPAEGVYVGYSFTVNSTGVQATNKPLALTYGTNPDSFYLHTQRNYLKWTDKSSELGGMLMLAVKLEGDIPGVSATISYPDELNFAQTAESITIPIAFQSLGSEPVKSIKFALQSKDNSIESTYEFESAKTMMIGKDYDLEVTFANELSEGMSYPSIIVKEINGKSNPVSNQGATQIGMYNYLTHPKKRPLFEEYTGLWCGWCPRGYVGLERMAEEYPDFIGVAIHNDDEMTVIYQSEYPSIVAGLPTGWMDRTEKLSPSYYNIKDLHEMASVAFTPVDLTLNAEYDEDANEVKFTAESNFVRPTGHDLRSFKYLLGNGLTRETWKQKNYFYDKDLETYPDMAQFIDAGVEWISGLIYNDVLIMADFGEEGTFPTGDALIPGIPVTENYTFNLADAMSRTNEKLNLASISKSFSVVYGILDATDNKVLNAFKVKGLGDTAVDSIRDDSSEVVATEYYDLFGRKADATSTGVILKRSIFANGKTRTIKTIKK